MGNTHTYFFRRPPISTFGGLITIFKGAGPNAIRFYKLVVRGPMPRTTLTRKSSSDLSLRYVRDFFAKNRRPARNPGKKSETAEAGAPYLIRTSRNFRNNEEDLGRNEVDSTDMEIFVFGRALLLRTS